MAFGNYYLLNPAEGWAAVCISKNACTSLKAAVLSANGRPVPATAYDVHVAIGYEESEFLRPVDAGPPPGVHVFAVWRDPIDRWYSAIAFLRQRDVLVPRRQVLGLANATRIRLSLGQAVAATQNHLAREPVECDEHLRRQHDYCDFSTLDSVVEVANLNAFFVQNGWQPLPHLNEASRQIERYDKISARIAQLYEADFALFDRADPTQPGPSDVSHTGVAGLRTTTAHDVGNVGS